MTITESMPLKAPKACCYTLEEVMVLVDDKGLALDMILVGISY